MKQFPMTFLAVCLVAVSACGGGGSVDTVTSSTTITPAGIDDEANLAEAEAFVNAFYSFDPAKLRASLVAAESSVPGMVFYQGWAEGANYEIVDRMACRESSGRYGCSITVEDDLAQALSLDFNVTDTFWLIFDGGELVRVNNTSNDPALVRQAFDWVFERSPELLDGVCASFFEDGSTPGECAQAVVQGFEDYAASAEFPTEP